MQAASLHYGRTARTGNKIRPALGRYMRLPRLLPLACVAVVCLHAAAGDDAHKERSGLLKICREQPGSEAYRRAVEALERLPSPLDRLSAEAINADDRKFLSIDGLVGLVRGHNRSVASVALSPDGRWLATSGWDNIVRVWRLGGAEPEAWASLDASQSQVAFHPSGGLLATGSAGSGVYLWDLTGREAKRKDVLPGHKRRPFVLAFAPTGRMLASGCHDPVLRIFKIEEGEPEMWAVLATDMAPSLGIASLAFSGDGKHLVAGSLVGRQSLRVWKAGPDYLEERDMPAARARLVACSPAEPIIAFAGDDAPIRLWRLDDAKELRVLTGHAGRGLPPAVKALAFSPSGKLLASAGQDRRLTVWDVASGAKRREWHLLDEVRALAFSADGRHLVTGNDDGTSYFLRLGGPGLGPAPPAR